tara:strand:- start:1616 stop:1984 length:369 start_codon:yes stop_codon:yes gene_type:complete
MIGFFGRLKWLITGNQPKPRPCNCGRKQPVDMFGNAIQANEPYARSRPLRDPSQELDEMADIEHIQAQSKGLGDTIAKATSAIGIKPCSGCQKRKEALNKAFPYEQKNTDNPEKVADDADSV